MNADTILHTAETANHWSITNFDISLYTSVNDAKPTPMNLVDWIKIPDHSCNSNKKFSNYSKSQSVSIVYVNLFRVLQLPVVYCTICHEFFELIRHSGIIHEFFELNHHTEHSSIFSH